MITAKAHTGGDYSVEFDAQPWLELQPLSKLSKLRDYQWQDCSYADECYNWTIENKLTDDLSELESYAAEGDHQIIIEIDQDEAEAWYRNKLMMRKVANRAVDRLMGESDDIMADVTGAALKPRTYYAYLTTTDGLRTVWMDKYGDPSETPQPFTFHEKNNRQNNGWWAYVKWMDASELKESDDELLRDVAHSALPDYKVQAAFDQALTSGRTKLTAWQDALKALGYHPKFIAAMGSLIASYVSFAWAHNSALAYEHVQDKLKKALLPQSHIQALLRLFAREISTYRKTESEGDDMLRDVAMAGANVPWVVAKQAWEQEVRFGSGESPWVVVLGALGYMDETARDVANSIDMLMASASDPGRDGGPEEFDEEWWLAWNDVEAELSRLNMPPSHVEAIKRIWRVQGPNQDMWESTEEQPQSAPDYNEDEMLQTVASVGINPAHALVEAIKHGKNLTKKQAASGAYTWELTVEVKGESFLTASPNHRVMVIVRAHQYLDDQPTWSSLRKKIGGYFWVKASEADKLVEPLTRLFKAARKGTLWLGEMEGAYNDLISHRFVPPVKTTKTGRRKKDIYSSGLYKYYS